ncbi:hypothetical protein JHK82_016365 [Glycine max]|nr:hypothetical protein JHK85_016777 [Glycine max]KAG5149484.1 hypothetical protein JHK82_016365 [Glycine max]
MPLVSYLYVVSKQISAAISPDQSSNAFKEVAISIPVLVSMHLGSSLLQWFYRTEMTNSLFVFTFPPITYTFDRNFADELLRCCFAELQETEGPVKA